MSMNKCLLTHARILKDFDVQSVIAAAAIYESRGETDDAANVAAIEDHLRELEADRDRIIADIISAWKLADPKGYAAVDASRQDAARAEYESRKSETTKMSEQREVKMSERRNMTQEEQEASMAEASAEWARKMASLKAGGKERDMVGNLLAPNGRKSNLTEAQYDQVRTPEFLGWFGDWLAAHKGKDEQGNGVWQLPDDSVVSKVVDENGEPLVVHHGTIFGGFTVLDPSKADGHRSSMVFTAKTRETSASYAGRKTEIDITGPSVEEMTGADLRQIGYQIYEDDEGDGPFEWDVWSPNGFLIGKFPTEEAAIADARMDHATSGEPIRTQSGIYSLFLNIRNPYEVDFEGANWDGQNTGDSYSVFDEDGEQVYDANGKAVFSHDDAQALVERESDGAEWNIEPSGFRGETTNDVAEEAKRYGNDGAIIRQVLDDGGKSAYVEVDDVYVFFDSKQAKSATQHVGPNYDTEDLRFSNRRPVTYTEPRRLLDAALPGLSQQSITIDGEVVGFVTLASVDDKPALLAHVEIFDEHRRKGYAEDVISNLMQQTDDLYIFNIQKDSIPFWQKMGVTLDEGEQWNSGSGPLTRAAYSRRTQAAEGRPKAGEEYQAGQSDGRGRSQEALVGAFSKPRIDPQVKAWADKVTSKDAGTVSPVVMLVRTPSPALNVAGIYRPIGLTYKHARHSFNTHPEVSTDDIAALPDLLQRPRAIMSQGEGSWQIIVDARTKEGAPMLVALNNEGEKGAKVTAVSSMYGKDKSAAFVTRELLAGRVLYMPEGEVARVQGLIDVAMQPSEELRSGHSLPPQAGLTPLPTTPNSERQVSVKTDGGAVKSVRIPSEAPARLGGVAFSPFRQTAADAIADVDLHYDILNNVKNRMSDVIAPTKGFNLWHKTVGTQFHKAMISPHFKKVFDLAQQFIDDVQLFALRAERVAPSIFPNLDKLTWANLKNMGLSATDNALLGKVLSEGTLDGGSNPHDGKVWSDAELRAKYSMTDTQIGQYRQARQAINQSLDELAASEMAQHMRISGADMATVQRVVRSAQPLATKYAQLVTLVDALELANPGKDYGETRRHLKGILSTTSDLQAHGYSPLMRFGSHTVTGYDPAGNVTFFTMVDTAAEAGVLKRQLAALPPVAGVPVYANIVTGKMDTESFKMFKGVTPDTLELFANHAAMPMTDLMQDYLKLAISNRSAMRRMIARQGTAGYSTDATRVMAGFITSNGRRASANLHMTALAQAVTDVPKEFGDIKSEASKLVEYIQNPAEEAAKLRGFLFFNFLGGSIAAGIVNLTQPVMQTLPYLSKYGTSKAAAAMTEALKHTGSFMRNKTVSDPDLQAALVQAQSDGHINPQEIYQLMAAANSGASSFLSFKIQRVWGLNFSVTEMFNRTLTFSAAYRLAKDSGSPTAYEDAVQAIMETQGLYNKGNRPNWARGPIGATIFTFKQFSISYMEFLKRAWGDGLIPKKQVVLALGLLILAAGTNGLPGADDLDDLIDTVGNWLGYATNSKRWKREFLTKWLGKEMAEFAMIGISKHLPADVQARLGVSNLIPGTALLNPTRKDNTREALEVLGVAGGFASSVGTAAEALVKGDPRKAALAVLPTPVRNALMAREMMETGKYKDIGNKLVTEVTPGDAITKGIGFQPNSVARRQRAIRESQIEADIVTSKQSEFMTRIANAVADNDGAGREKAMDDLRKWNEKNPDYRIRINAGALRQAIRQRVMSKDIRFIKQVPKTIRARINEDLQEQGVS